ncbi:MAG TPA: hypothetical protein VI895_13400 [Bdellovibrionota bacterium]|nr:hypothetical protein [Bdellovibrionota bacterium]
MRLFRTRTLPIIAGCYLLGANAVAYPDKVAGVIPLSIQPLAARVGPTDRYIYVLDSSRGSLVVVDTLSFSEKSTVQFSGTPRDLAFSQDGTILYVVIDAADSVLSFDLKDPSTPASPTTISIGTSGVTFDNLEVAGSSGADILVLSSRSQSALYYFSRTSDELVKNGSQDRIDVGFDPVSLSLSPDFRRVAAISSDGKFKTFLASALSQAGAELDLGAQTTTQAFGGVHVGAASGGTYAFLSNNVSPGEIFMVNMVQTDNNLFISDADSSTTALDPIVVGDGPSGSLVLQVNRSLADTSAGAAYLFAANRTAGTLSVVDTADIGGAAKVEPIATIDSVPDVPPGGLAASSTDEGYLYALNNAGASVSVVTDQPFLTVTSAPSGSIGTGNFSLFVRSNVTGTLSVVRYTGTTDERVSKTNGSLLTSASLDADIEAEVSIPSENFEEGSNTLALFLDSGTLIGRTAVDVVKDTPPPAPTGFRLSFGNQKIFAAWDKVEEADISHYNVYFGTTDGAEGGFGSLSSPQRVEQTADSALTLQPIDNGTTLFVRVTVVDQSGNESAPTETLSETAEQTIGILELSGETGGCAASAVPPILFSVIFLLSVPARRREAAAIMFLVVCSAASTRSVSAETLTSAESVPPVRASTEFRVGWWLPQDDLVNSFFGNGGNEIYTLRFGVRAGSFDFGFEGGFFSEDAALVGVSSGRQSGEESRLTLVPMEFSAQYNVEIGARPLAVPFVRAGYDLIYFDIHEPQASENGAKQAITVTGGVRLMLERFVSGNDLQDLMGIEHFFLEVLGSYRHQFSKGLDVSGWIVQPGLGVEF